MSLVPSLIEKDDWNGVERICRKAMLSKSNVTVFHAMYNMILKYEVEGKLDSAYIMARNCYGRFPMELTVNYGLILEDRIKEDKLVQKQMNDQAGE